MRLVMAAAACLIAVTAVVGIGTGARATDQAPPLPLETLFGGGFSLIDHTGMPRTERDYHGRHVLVYFGYTWCPDICPTSLLEIETALDALGSQGSRVTALFVSLDPRRDTPAVLADYVSHFGTRIIGLTGSEEQVAAVARAYRLHRVKVVPQWSEGDDDYLVDHSSLTFLLDPDGRVATLFPHGTVGADMADRIRAYLEDDGG